ncbi:MAG: hypothetical protein EA001_11140 [Oscillatoriales cyanobacterium]|nr:MAG: hypothetical protein EA001_11140 [Oscillatoriales cyanobacterium]
MVLSAVLHIATLPLLADWNPESTSEPERKVALLELTPEEQQQLPAFAREALAAQPGDLAGDPFSRLGLGSDSTMLPRSNPANPGTRTRPSNDPSSSTWPGTGATSGGNRWSGRSSGLGIADDLWSTWGQGGWQVDPFTGDRTDRSRRGSRSNRGGRGQTGNRQGSTGNGNNTGNAVDPNAVDLKDVTALADRFGRWTLPPGSTGPTPSGSPGSTPSSTPTGTPEGGPISMRRFSGINSGSFTYNSGGIGPAIAQKTLIDLSGNQDDEWMKLRASKPMQPIDGKMPPGTQGMLFRLMNPEPNPPIPLTYPRAILCALNKPPQIFNAAVLVGPDRKIAPIAKPVRLLSSSGYEALDLAALETITKELQGKILVDRPGYLIQIYTLAYGDCSGSKPSVSPSPSPRPSPNPSPSPSPTSQTP